MKPIKLTMVNIGPFKNESIDFDTLGSMFLISGKTGSGKTTIFDSMTFALYGNLPGSRKGHQEEFRSDFCSEKDESYVDFTFSIDNHLFRVNRSLPYQHIKKNGESETKPQKVNLWTSVDSGKSWEEFSGKLKQVNEKIEKDIIRLSFEEFNKIVLLPQGAFSQFFKQSSKERSETLQNLFPVDTWVKIKDAAREKANSCKSELSAIENQIKVFQEKHKIEDLEITIQSEKEELENLKKQTGELQSKKEKLMLQSQKTKDEFLLAQEAQKLQEELQALYQRQEKMEVLKSKISLSQEAQKLSHFIFNYERSLKQEANCQSDYKKRQENLFALNEEEKKLQEEKDNFEGKKILLKEKTSLLQVKDNQLKQTKNYEQALFTAREKQEDYNRLFASYEKKEESFKQLKKQEEVFFEKLHVAKDQDIIEELVTKLHKSSSRLNSLTAAKKYLEELLQSKEKVREAEKDEKEQGLLLQNARVLLETFEKQQEEQEQKQKAAFLARLLKASSPCPVCGSIDHPNPAKEEKGLSLIEKIETQRGLVNNQEKIYQVAFSKLASAKANYENAESNYENARVENFSSLEELATEIQKEEVIYKNLQEDYSNLKSLKNQLVKIQEEREKEKNKLSEEELNLTSLNSQVQTLLESIKGSSGEIEDSKKVSEDLTLLKTEIQKLENDIANFDKRMQNFSNTHSSALALEKSTRQKLEESQVTLQKAKEDLDKNLQGSTFTSLDKAKEALSFAENVSKMQNELSDWQSKLEKTKTLYEAKKQDTDTNALEKKFQELSEETKITAQKLDELSASFTSKSADLQAMIESLRAFRELETKRKECQEAAQAYIQLSNDLTGNNSKKIQFDTWILAMYFEEVVAAANSRLFDLSGGRYTFKLDSENTDGNSYKGLDLLISDSKTGQDRNPSTTFSGGETFEASLSLALGLTDVVENKSGGVRLDSLFIDEGFGTLDDELLDRVIEILHRIQENRTVGLISHVSEMQGAILSKVEVEKGNDGHSTIKMPRF